MIRRLAALVAVTAFAVAGVTLAASTSRHAGPPARITVTPASAAATAPVDELDSIPAPVAVEAPTAAPVAVTSSPSKPSPASPAVVPVADNHPAAPLPAASVDAKPVTVARTAAVTPAPAVEGDQPYTAPVPHRDPRGFCYGAGPADLPVEDAADPTCTPNTPAPPVVETPAPAGYNPLTNLYPAAKPDELPQPHTATPSTGRYPKCWTGCTPGLTAPPTFGG